MLSHRLPRGLPVERDSERTTIGISCSFPLSSSMDAGGNWLILTTVIYCFLQKMGLKMPSSSFWSSIPRRSPTSCYFWVTILLFSFHYRDLIMLHLMKTECCSFLPLALRVSFSTVSVSFLCTQGTLDGHFASYFQGLITSAMGHMDHQATWSMKLVHSVGINLLMDHLKSRWSNSSSNK